MPEEKLTVFDTCLKITSKFEGASFDTVTGNFDGQGMSLGILQWNINQGTFRAYILNHLDLLMFDYFPVPITPLYSMDNSASMAWVKDVVLDMNGNVKPEWNDAFKRFLTESSVINLQKRACDKYFHRAKEICGILGFTHENKRAMAFSFDIAVQSWSLGIDRPEANHSQADSITQIYGVDNYMLWNGLEMSEEQQILIIAAHLRALKCKPEWRNVFFTRKCTIALGLGIVNKEKHDFRKLFTES